MDYFEGSALVKQIGTLFDSMLRQKRLDRAMEFVKGLHEVLFVHCAEIGSSDTVVERLLQHVPTTFSHSVALGLDVFRAIYDIELGDQHEKRRRCMTVLLEIAEATTATEVIGEMRMIILDQLSSSSECVRQAVQKSLAWIKNQSPTLRQLGLDVITMLVQTCPHQLRAQKDATRELRPSFLIQQSLMGCTATFRCGAARLIADIVRNGVSDISFEGACDIASEVEAALHGEDPNSHFGALALLREFLSCRPLLAANWNWRKCATCLLTTNWSSYADDECVLTCQILSQLTRFDIDCDEIVDGLSKVLLSNNPRQSAAACEGIVFLLESNPTAMQKMVHRVLEAVRTHLQQSYPAWTNLLELFRTLTALNPSTALKSVVLKVAGDTDPTDLERGSWLARLSNECGGWTEADLEVFAKFPINLDLHLEASELSTVLIAARNLRRTSNVMEITHALDHCSIEVRKTAVLSLIALSEELVLQNAEHATTKRLDSVVTKVIEKLLDCAVVDRDTSVRTSILSGLTNSFDAYLSLPDHIEALCMARNDVAQSVRDEAVRILCRLLPCNPAFVHPQLLRAQEELLKEIETKDATVGAVFHCTRQLRLMISDTTLLVQAKPIEVSAVERLDRLCFVSRSLVVELLRLLGAVLDISGNSTQHCDLSLAVHVMLNIIQNGNNNLVRCTAIETLCSIVSIPGFAWTDGTLSKVFNVVGTILRDDRNEDDELRRRAPRVIAVIGGFHPARLRTLVSKDEVSEDNLLRDVMVLQPHPRFRPHIDETFPSTVVYLLLKVTITAADPKAQSDALSTLYDIIATAPDNHKAALVPHVVPTLRKWLLEPEKSHLRCSILRILTDFTLLLRKFKEVVGFQVGNDILLSLQSLCALPEASQKPLNVHIVGLLDALATEMPVQDMREHRWAVEFILQRLSQDKEDSALVLRVVKSLDSLISFLRERDSRNVLPQVLQCIDATQDMQVNRSCFDFIGGIVDKQPSLAKDCCAQIVHTSIRFIEETKNISDVELSLTTLANLITTVAQRAARFIPPIQAAAKARGLGPETFEKALAAASQGLHKVKIPALPPDEVFKSDGTIHVVSSIHLTQKDFENELTTAIRAQTSDFELLGISHPGGQTVITFRFLPNERAETNVAAFAKRAVEPQSALRRNLAIVNVFQKEDTVLSCPADFIMCLRQLPEGRKRKRELPWILWLTSLANWFLRMSPHKPLKAIATIASGSHELSKDIFPFAVGSFVKAATPVDRKIIMNSLAQALTKAPYDIRQAIFSFAEFLEVERGERRLVLVKNSKTVMCDVERENPDQKFGINYDQETRGIVVSKLAPDGLGARAGVPVNAVLVSINGTQVKSVQQIRSLIAGLNKIQLVLQTVIEEKQESEPVAMIDISVLANVALEAQMHAKATYFNEILLMEQLQKATQVGNERRETHSLLSTVEKLIELYNFIGIPMEAKGVVRTVSTKLAENVLAPERFGFDEAATLEKLQWWNEALRLYSASATENSSLVGMLRCYDALGDFDLVLDLSDRNCSSQMDIRYRAEVGRLRSNAAFALGKWDVVEEVFDDPACTQHMDGVALAVALFRRKRFDELLKHCKEQREGLFEKYCEHFSDSMIRANDIVVEMQYFSHFEELVSFASATDDRRALLKSLWKKRLSQMSKKPQHWKTIVAISSLVLNQDEDLTSRVECALVCSKQGWVRYAEHLLKSLMGVSSLVGVPNLAVRDPHIIHAYLKHTYLSGRRLEAREMMSATLNAVGAEPGVTQPDVWSKCWMLMGEWSAQDSPIEATLCLKNATQLNAKNANAFHALGVLHHDIARGDVEVSSEGVLFHVVEGMGALFSSVQLSDGKNSVTQDLLRILTLWFRHGDSDSVDACFRRGIAATPNHVWLRVIPQLVARIGIASFKTRELLGELLIKVGSQFPQAFMYPLHVSEKSNESLRHSMASKVLNGIRVNNEQLIREAITISQELERMAILWPEKWHSQIQAAAAKQDNAAAVLTTLQPLFDELDRPVTPHERNFEKSCGQLLKRAKTALTQQVPSLELAWAALKQVWQQLNSKALAERKLIMAEVSPTLDNLKNCPVCVPGTFDPWRTPVHIASFNSRINILSSKQKPRRFGIVGSDGKQYYFLLKGHEDLRQDERVMQFIQLVNAIFAYDAGSMAQGLNITSYAVVPLSDNVGIIGWVEETETIFKMLETHRKEHNMSIYEEVNIMTKKANLANIDDYHKLPKAQRKALLSYVFTSTPADELTKIIWTKNDSCEQWLEYRRVYANTLATMSMVGYVLGLGDRHLNNLMLQHGGAVVHIDFGDCFEVAMHRPHFAEAVPFRLTRFLIAPLGVSGADGSYRHTCEHVMKLLRRHRENLLSVLEAFIFDPLINWTLSTNPTAMRSLPDQAEVAAPLASSARFRESHQPEKRNQQADSALVRVQAKLSGEDFGGHLTKSEKDAEPPVQGPTFLLESTLGNFSESPKESVIGALLPTYLMSDTSRREALDVPSQVSKLIAEATSLDNLAEAYVTGWAPFW